MCLFHENEIMTQLYAIAGHIPCIYAQHVILSIFLDYLVIATARATKLLYADGVIPSTKPIYIFELSYSLLLAENL